MEEGMRKLNIMEDMAEDRQQWRHATHTSESRCGKLGTLTENDDDDGVNACLIKE